MHAINVLLTFGVTLVMFALIFKYLPDARIAWSDVWIGAAITALLFNVGKYLIGLYLGMGAVGSSYGAAGSFVVLLLWIYYSTLILLLGAEFTRLYAARFGRGFGSVV
jgi:membrane protein